jgi:uncharacterized repeat protein (TIGR02543 family)
MRFIHSRLRAIVSSVAGLAMVAGSILLGAGAAQAVTVNNNNQLLRFVNAAQVNTGDATVGTPYRYAGITTIGGQVIDALLSVSTLTGTTSITAVDQTQAAATAVNAEHYWINSDMTLNDGSGAGGSVTYTITFVEGGTSTPITVQNVAISVSDIDRRQFAQFTGVTSYLLSNSTKLHAQTHNDVSTIPATAYRFWDWNNSSSDATTQTNWVEVRYESASSLDVILGATVNGGAYFSIDFEPSLWAANTTTTSSTTNATPHTLSYDPNAGSGSAPSSTTGSGSITTAPAGTGLTRTGYTFAGWNTQANGSGTSYQPGDALDLSSDITLFAVWTADAASPAAPALATTGMTSAQWAFMPAGAALLLFGFALLLISRRSQSVRRESFKH